MARALRANSTLTRLSLRSCGIKTDSLLRFFEKLRATSTPIGLRRLDVSGNAGIDVDEARAALAEMRELAKLQLIAVGRSLSASGKSTTLRPELDKNDDDIGAGATTLRPPKK